MTRHRRVWTAGCLAVWAVSAGPLGAGAPQQPSTRQSSPPESPQRAVVDRYCVGCHNDRAKTGGLALDTLDVGRAGEHADTWEKVVRTPFLLAARTADAGLMRALATLGADALLPNEDNSTPLMVAAGLGTQSPGEDPGTEPEVLEAVALARELGNDVNAVDKNGETAMHSAAYKHVPSVVRFLASKGAGLDIWNQPNKRGWTPLKIAEGIQRGMNIVSSAPTAAAIREVMTAPWTSPARPLDEPRGLQPFDPIKPRP